MKQLRRNEWVSISEAATRLATNEACIRQWIHRNKTDVARKGTLVLFAHIEEIEARIRLAVS